MSNNASVRSRSFVTSAELRAVRGKNGAYFVEDGGLRFSVILKQDEYIDHTCND